MNGGGRWGRGVCCVSRGGVVGVSLVDEGQMFRDDDEVLVLVHGERMLLVVLYSCADTMS